MMKELASSGPKAKPGPVFQTAKQTQSVIESQPGKPKNLV